MLTPDIAERHLLSSLTDLERYRACVDYGIRGEYFTAHRPVWDFISQYYEEYRQPPESDLFQSKFPDFELTNCLPIDPCINEIVTIHTHSKVIGYLKSKLGGKTSALNENPREFVRQTLKFLSEVEFEQTKRSHSVFDHDPTNRLLRYYDKVEKNQKSGIFGISTGFPTLDGLFYGWKPGEFISIIARLGLGKSWLLSYFALQAFHTGKRVLFVSPEMSKEQVEDRLDTIYSYMLRGQAVQNSMLSFGRGIDASVYEQYLKSIKNEDRFHIYDSDLRQPFTVRSITDMVETIRPDMVVVDGVPLLAPDFSTGSATHWEDFKVISYGLKRLAETMKVVVMAASWANREAGVDPNSKQRTTDLSLHPTIEQISYSDAIGQASDMAFSIALPKDPAERKTSRTIKMLKSRSTKLMEGLIKIDFDVENGIIKENTAFSGD